MSEKEEPSNDNILEGNINNNKNENNNNIAQEVNDKLQERPTLVSNPRYTRINSGFSIDGYDSVPQVNTMSENKDEEKNEGKDEENKENIVIKSKEHKNSLNMQTYNLKIIVIGDIAVGKTSLIRRYIDNTFSDDYKASISCENKNKKVDIDGETVADMQIWDTAGEEKFMSITRQYYNNSHGALVIYDLTNKDSFIKMSKWIKDLKDNAPENITIMIVGNKSDLPNKKVNLESELKYYKEKYEHFEVSAKTGTNVSLAFEKLAFKIIEKIRDENKKGSEKVEVESVALKANMGNKKKKKCQC